MTSKSDKIRAAIAKNPNATNSDLAERFDVSSTLVSHIRNAKKRAKAAKANGVVVKATKVTKANAPSNRGAVSSDGWDQLRAAQAFVTACGENVEQAKTALAVYDELIGRRS